MARIRPFKFIKRALGLVVGHLDSLLDGGSRLETKLDKLHGRICGDEENDGLLQGLRLEIQELGNQVAELRDELVEARATDTKPVGDLEPVEDPPADPPPAPE